MMIGRISLLNKLHFVLKLINDFKSSTITNDSSLIRYSNAIKLDIFKVYQARFGELFSSVLGHIFKTNLKFAVL